MSGTGQSGSSAPSYLTPMAVDQPLGQTHNGDAVLPSPYFAQVIVRILAYLGQPVSSSSSKGGSALTVGEQIAALQESISLIEAISSSSQGLGPRLTELEAVVAGLMAVSRVALDAGNDAAAKTIATWGM